MDENDRLAQLEKSVKESVQASVDKAAVDLNTPDRSGVRRRNKIIVLLAGWGILGWIWGFRPAIIFGDEPERPSLERQEASIRFGIFLQRHLIEDYISENGALPPNLEALRTLGAPDEDVTYTRVGSGYVLKGSTDSLELTLTDKMDADSFLGDALVRLRTDL